MRPQNKHLNSVKGIPGPGRKKLTEDKKIEKQAIKEYYKQYLEKGEGVSDHKKLRKKQPGEALKMAENRTYGTPTTRIDGDLTATITIKREVIKSPK